MGGVSLSAYFVKKSNGKGQAGCFEKPEIFLDK